MADPDISQEEQEQIIFQFFVQAAQLPVVSGSIRSLPPSNRPPLNPDILCEIQGRGPVAFELVEIVTQAHVQEKENGKRLEKAFKAACERHSQIAVRFSDALIYVGFLKHITIRQRLSVVPEVVHGLRQHSEDSMGYIEVPRKLQKFLTEISVTRGVSDGPAFGVMEMTDHTEEVFVQIEKKCKRNIRVNIRSNSWPITQTSLLPIVSIGSPSSTTMYSRFYPGVRSNECGSTTIGIRRSSMFTLREHKMHRESGKVWSEMGSRARRGQKGSGQKGSHLVI